MALLGFWGCSVFAAIFQPSKAVTPIDTDTDTDTDTVPAGFKLYVRDWIHSITLQMLLLDEMVGQASGWELDFPFTDFQTI